MALRPFCADDRRGDNLQVWTHPARPRLWQREDHNTVADRRTARERTAGGDHGHILLAVLAAIGDGRGMGGSVELVGPDFLARGSLKSVEAAIIGRNHRGLYMVSSGNFTSKKEAVKGLRKLQKEQRSAWLFESN